MKFIKIIALLKLINIMEQETNLTPKRTTFLTVLCVLTFIGSAIGVFSSISNILTADVSSKMIETMGNSIDEAVESSNDQGATTMQDESDTLLDVNEILDSTNSEMTEAEIVESGEQAIEDVANNVENKSAEAAANMMKSLVGGISAETIKNNAYASILAAILTLIGAIMMWKLRKIGFWIYVLGTVIGIVAPLIIYSGNLLGAISAIGIGFFGILFVVLYAINKKQLVY
jgi:hypothetical protein